MKAPVQISTLQARQLGDFEQLVKDYIEVLEVHRFAPIGVPAPTAHPLVESAVLRVQYPVEGTYQPTVKYEEARENGKVVTIEEPQGEPVRFTSSNKPDDFIPNYILIDDTPLPPTLEVRKNMRAQSLLEEAQTLCNAIIPPLKIPLMQIRYGQAASVPVDMRTDEQSATIADFETKTTKMQAIHYHLAQLQSDLHDLDEAAFEQWVPAPFPT